MIESNTKKMTIDIDSIEKGDYDPVSKFEFLNNIESWRNMSVDFISKMQMIRYLVILYSYDSILNKKNPTKLYDRKIQAMVFADIDIENETVQLELVNLKNDVILLLIQDFLIAQRNNLWTEIVTTEQQYEEAIRLRLQPIDREAKDKDQLDAALKKKMLRLDCKEMNAEIDKLYKQFYLDHNDVEDGVRRRSSTLEAISKSAKYV